MKPESRPDSLPPCFEQPLSIDDAPAPKCDCRERPSWNRREFLVGLGLGAGALALKPWGAMAGPFTRKDFEKLVPADKKLRPEWVRSLTARGERAVYRGTDLERIGMPVGGLCAGQVYLGGDGRLWHWDIFNQHLGTGAEHYAKPLKAAAPFLQGFAIRVCDGFETRPTGAGKRQERPLDREHWRDVSFTGEYPIGYVNYADPECPVKITLEAFSPFTPLSTDDSSLPAVVMEFTIQNGSRAAVEVVLAGWLENAVCLHSAQFRDGSRRNRLVRRDGLLALNCSAEEAPAQAQTSSRPEIVFDDFERELYAPWTATGTAFGKGPVEMAKIPAYQGDVAGKGKRVVNTHASAPGNEVEQRDSAKGTLTSRPFKIERNYINFLIGGGAHQGRTCMNLLVEGKIVLSATGKSNNRMEPASWDVRRWVGQSATLQIVDDESGGWGNIGIDDIVFSDSPKRPPGPLGGEADFGTMSLALLEAGKSDFGCAELQGPGPASACECGAGLKAVPEAVNKAWGTGLKPVPPLIGAVGRRMKIRAGGTAKVTFVISWNMPNLKKARLPAGRYYGTRFDSALAVLYYLQKNFESLAGNTRLWHDTWYDSTLPYWFLDRTFLNTSILATSTCYRLGGEQWDGFKTRPTGDGRFYAWEGVGCCEGTCGHVWQYAQAPARLFPDLERLTREKVDFGLAQQPDGAIHFRGEFNDIPAIDAQAGTILRALREHQMSADDAFLKRNWPRIKKATGWLMAKDANNDGLIEGNQHNTLDTDWFGPVAWLSGLYLAALLAAEYMALEAGDREFASQCGGILDVGRKKLVTELFDGEYFINKPDPKHPEAINSGTGCEIDQVLGQSWAFQVGLPRVLPEKETRAALKALWRYNFSPDVGPYRDRYKPGRWYAMPGEAGLLMCTFPRSDWDYEQAKGKGPDWAAGYFNECMNGFEYQAAGHMIWEGLITEGLAVTRAVHDRYHPSRRNPWNEVECGDHYARSMASYGVFLAACGYEYHGPKGHLGFAPRLTPADFKAPFTAAEGWGTFAQKYVLGAAGGPPRTGLKPVPPGLTGLKPVPRFSAELSVKWGQLRLRTLALTLPDSMEVKAVRVLVNERPVKHQFSTSRNRLTLSLAEDLQLKAKSKLQVHVA